MDNEKIIYTGLGTESFLFDESEDYDLGFPSELLPISKENAPAIYDQSKRLIGLVVQYKEMMMMYACAAKEMRTRFEVLNSEFNLRTSRNPIKFINTRLKRSSSLVEKMERLGTPLSIENIEANINDVAGIRVICSYVDDIYMIAQALIRQNDIELISQKDYIANPKPNGYRSLHMIVRIPVHFEGGTKYVKVEVQIRTIAMDFWATLEHELKYKNQFADGDKVANELMECANIISDADEKMLAIRKWTEENSTERTEEDLLIEKIKKLDLPID